MENHELLLMRESEVTFTRNFRNNLIREFGYCMQDSQVSDEDMKEMDLKEILLEIKIRKY